MSRIILKYRKLHFHILSLSFLILLFYSCRTKKIEPDGNLIGYDYYPIETGLYYIYKVTDTIYKGVLNDQENYIDSTYFIKEEIFTPITINDETKYQVYRYYSKNATDFQDQPDSVWTVFNDRTKIIKAENNYRYIKLIFPPENKRTWDGNAENIFDEDIYTALNYRKPYRVGSGRDATTYDYTVTVLQEDEQNLVNKDYRIEVYAQGVGLIYKKSIIVNYEQPITPANRIDVGKKSELKLISYGRK
jgi:hypothetical protein